MDLMSRIKQLWRRHDERLEEEGLRERAIGGDEVFLTPGADRTIQSQAARSADAAEHDEPQ
jgi:hypothetical protein